MNTLKVAAYQMPVTASPEHNFDKINDGVERAAKAGADIIALPECALSGYPPYVHTHPSDIDIALIGELNAQVCDLAAKHRIRIICGTILESTDGLLNSALLISPDGEIEGRYDKLHLMQDEKKFFAPGASLGAFDIGKAVVGIQICYDFRFPETFRLLREAGAQVIFNIFNACGSSTWKIPVMEGTIRARSAENTCYVAGVNAAGPMQFCQSRICNPLGVDVVSAPLDSEELLIAELDLSETEDGIYFDRRNDLYSVSADFLK